ncbi:MAG: 50S ribosomal protein L3 [Zestosphaera sp.]
MARRKWSAPRRGSLGVRPRKRAAEFVPSVRSWPEVGFETPKPLAFLGYKVGMTHVIMVDDREGRPTHGQEIFVPVTVIETPPMIPLAARFYEATLSGLRTLTEVWKTPPEDLEIHRRVKTLSVSTDAFERAVRRLEEMRDRVARISLIMSSQPKLTGGLSKKVPDVIEVRLGGGDLETQLSYALELLGRPVRIADVFNAGQFIDVIGVTKGKGFQGVVKRFGVRELPKWHKHRKGYRRIGARSPAYGTVSTVPQPGQMGFHRRTEYNKRILMIGEDGSKVTPVSGFPHYGLVKTDYVVVAGSVQGTPKRPLILRWPVRPPKWAPGKAPKVVYISLDSKI